MTAAERGRILQLGRRQTTSFEYQSWGLSYYLRVVAMEFEEKKPVKLNRIGDAAVKNTNREVPTQGTPFY